MATKRQPTKAAKPSRPDVKVFIAEYKVDRNGRRAAIAAGYSERSADSTASRLLRSAKVRAEVEQHHADTIAKIQADTGITLERTLREIARIAYFDPRNLFNPDGTPKAITDLDADAAAVIAGLDVLEEFDGSGKDRVLVGHIKKWKIASKDKALDMLMKHLGGYAKDNERKVEVTGDAPPLDIQDVGRRVAFVLAATMHAANDPTKPKPATAAA